MDTASSMVTDVFRELISSWQKTFIAIILIFALFPFVFIGWNAAQSAGLIGSPMEEQINKIEKQHVAELTADLARARSITANYKELLDNKKLMLQVIKNDDRAFKAMVTNCFLNASLIPILIEKKEGQRRCERLQSLE